MFSAPTPIKRPDKDPHELGGSRTRTLATEPNPMLPNPMLPNPMPPNPTAPNPMPAYATAPDQDPCKSKTVQRGGDSLSNLAPENNLNPTRIM